MSSRSRSDGSRPIQELAEKARRGRIRTADARLMGPVSCRCSTLHRLPVFPGCPVARGVHPITHRIPPDVLSRRPAPKARDRANLPAFVRGRSRTFNTPLLRRLRLPVAPPGRFGSPRRMSPYGDLSADLRPCTGLQGLRSEVKEAPEGSRTLFRGLGSPRNGRYTTGALHGFSVSVPTLLKEVTRNPEQRERKNGKRSWSLRDSNPSLMDATHALGQPS